MFGSAYQNIHSLTLVATLTLPALQRSALNRNDSLGK